MTATSYGLPSISDSDIENFRQHHNEISMSVNDTDDFLMFHNAGAFCFQLFDVILILYYLIFFRDANDPVVIIMLAYWMFGCLWGLAVTTGGGIMINRYVSTKLQTLFSCKLLRIWVLMKFRDSH